MMQQARVFVVQVLSPELKSPESSKTSSYGCKCAYNPPLCRSLAIPSHQSYYQFTEWPRLKGIRYYETEQDTSLPSLASACTQACMPLPTSTHTKNYILKRSNNKWLDWCRVKLLYFLIATKPVRQFWWNTEHFRLSVKKNDLLTIWASGIV